MESPAVLFLVFNRPEHTRFVLDAIRKAQPKKLYISSDGPNANKPGEAELVKKVRKIAQTPDWDCEVKTLFHEQNLGCRVAVSRAIDWLFEHEEEGIILEDDCLPSQSFFRYCSELLDYYRDDKQVMCVSGDNFQQGRNVSEDSYYFSRYPHCWGWATWKDAWSQYDEGMDQWEVRRNIGVIDQWSDAGDEFHKYWVNAFDAAVGGKVDSWSYRWLYSCWKQQGLTCLPQKNLVKNIGFTEAATHTKQSEVWYSKLEHNELSFPLRHPRLKERNVKADEFTDRELLGIVKEENNLNFINKITSLFESLKLIMKRRM